MRTVNQGRRSITIGPAPADLPRFHWFNRQSWQSLERGRRSYRRLILWGVMLRSVSLTPSRIMLARMGLACILD